MQSGQEPTRLDLEDKSAAARHVPLKGPDLALTAFCQLGALRLAARRSLLFFFDRKDAYVLAEATRTLSLLDHETYHDDEDGLWLGHTVVSRGSMLREHSMSVPASNTGWNSTHDNAGDLLVINDLLETSNSCDRPFVTACPNARFYAGVPLTTSAGTRIGVYAVMDDKPRSGLSPEEEEFMKEMSSTTMAHLQMIHAQSELSRQSRMLSGLSTFVKDGPPPAPRPTCTEPSTPTDDWSPVPRRKSEDDSPPTSPSSKRRRARRSQEGLRNTEVHDFVSESEQEPADRRSISQAQRRLDKQMDRDSGAGARNTLQRAADVIRHAVDADGVLFLDASPHGVDGTGSCQGSGTDTGTTDGDPDAGSDDSLQKTHNNECRSLGDSCRVSSPIDPERVAMSDKFLKKLLRRHPQGKIWTFNSDGEVSSTESGSSDASSSPADKDGTARHTVSRQGRKSNEASEIRRLFPEARAVCLTPMWDPIRGKWFAAGLMWTYSPSRVFSSQAELAYMLAFCDVVMAKISRREAKLTDRAKTDFISSVSHELRSPLHGIVGSLELLQEREVTGDRPLIAQMEKCCKTLTDVIDHLLDFAKINHHVSRSKVTRKQLSISGRRPSLESLALSVTSEEATHSLARLTEEVASATYYSHCCNVGQETSNKIDFALDISPNADFHVCDAVGAWKRLCANLIGNALKFTKSGHVAASLKALSRRRKRPVAVLTVSDTGCGMSQEFVQSGLFRAFAQEDPLTPGAGLGLSVVAKLVKGLGGKIEVNSAQHTGTTITVTIPIDAPRENVATKANPVHNTARLGLLQLVESEEEDGITEARRLHLSGIESACRGVGANLTSSAKANINLLFQEDLAHLLVDGKLTGHSDGAHLVVLCRSLLSTFQLQKSQPRLRNVGHVEYVAQPFGPECISSAIANCLQASENLGQRHDDSEVANDERVYPTMHEGAQTGIERSHKGAIHLESTSPRNLLLDSDKPSMILSTIEVESSSSDRSHTPESPTLLGDRKLSLLLVDDNPINLRLLCAYADKNKHPRLTAVNGQEAVNAYKAAASMNNGTAKPDVVFLDINMPVLDGFQAARQIRAFEKEVAVTPTILIALTCLGSDKAKEEARKCGIDMFLTKPVRPRDLTAILQNVQELDEEV